MISTQRLWYNSDKTKVVPEGHPEASFLLCGIGHAIDDKLAVQFGLMEDNRKEIILKLETPKIDSGSTEGTTGNTQPTPNEGDGKEVGLHASGEGSEGSTTVENTGGDPAGEGTEGKTDEGDPAGTGTESTSTDDAPKGKGKKK